MRKGIGPNNLGAPKSMAKNQNKGYGSTMAKNQNKGYGSMSKKMGMGAESMSKASKYGAMIGANIEKGMNPTEAGKKAAEDIKKEK
jgi:hypothetical protein|tara:strand:- start:1053 stop:1310 length:258 start_codon:yes stop_codon:yes gene_type:complete